MDDVIALVGLSEASTGQARHGIGNPRVGKSKQQPFRLPTKSLARKGIPDGAIDQPDVPHFTQRQRIKSRYVAVRVKDVRAEFLQKRVEPAENEGIPTHLANQIEKRDFESFNVRNVKLLFTHGYHQQLDIGKAAQPLQ